MSFERTAPSGIGAEPAPVPAAAEGGEPRDVATASPAMRLQILSTEHWSLLASRSLAWNESFSRAGMFLSTLSGAIVALALVAQASAFGEGFRWFALVILPVVLFIGVTTFVRLGASNYHDAQCVIGMNRIRHAYLELAPDLERYFVMSPHDDVRGVGITMGMPPGGSTPVHILAATPTVVSVINSVIFGAIAALGALSLGADMLPALLIGIGGFVAGMAAHQAQARRTIMRGQASVEPVFPGPLE